jgi:hypothetical protein
MPPPSFQKSAEKAAQISSKIFIEIDSSKRKSSNAVLPFSVLDKK